jgi:class I fructose-bisphosphate aldolase
MSMTIGKATHLRRLFAHPSGHFCSIAIDHFIGYGEGLPPGLRHIRRTLEAVMEARPDAVTMHKGIAQALWTPYAGIVPLILQTSAIRVDDSACEQIATPEDAIRLGADAVAVAAFVRGGSETAHLRIVAECVREAERFALPVICHIYPRTFTAGAQVSFAPEDIAWATRCAVEVGADVVKTPYCGDPVAQAEIAADCPVPLVAAGGPAAPTLEDALALMAAAVRSGMRGATIGRNVWNAARITATVRAFQAVIHEGATPQAALAAFQATE